MHRKLGKVSTKGAIVIDSRIRKELGIEPGWETLQRVDGRSVVIEFLPPVRVGAAFGRLRPKGDATWLETEEALNAAIEAASQEAAAESNR